MNDYNGFHLNNKLNTLGISGFNPYIHIPYICKESYDCISSTSYDNY